MITAASALMSKEQVERVWNLDSLIAVLNLGSCDGARVLETGNFNANEPELGLHSLPQHIQEAFAEKVIFC